MKLYRLFYKDADGKIVFEDMKADNDEQAVKLARGMKIGVDRQVWDRQKLIASIPKYPRPLA